MSKWKWAFGAVSIPKFRWAVTAGDQDPESPDDKKCGDHYIDKDLECHEGDAHRPDPGNNPYWQGGRKGPPGEDSGGKGKSEDGSRDRREVTKKAEKKESGRQERGEGFTPERAANFAEDTLNDYMDMAQENYGENLDWDSEHGKKLMYELAEKSIRDTAREYAGQMDQRAAKKYLPGRDHEDNRPDPGVGPREMFRPKVGDQPITFEAPEHGVPVHVPKAPGMSVFRDLIDKARSGRDKPPRRKEAIEHTKRKESSQEAASTLVSDMNWSAESKIMMDRADPKPGDPGCPSEEDLLALNSALPPLPGDSAEGRPCGEGEDPERGHCKGPGGPSSPAGPMSDDPKVLRKMAPPGGKPPGAPKGLGIPEDPQRKARTATQTQILKNSDPKDSKRTSWAVSKMFGGGAVKEVFYDEPRGAAALPPAISPFTPKRKKVPKGLGGSSQPMPEQLAFQQYDDARHSMEQSGWQETSNSGQGWYGVKKGNRTTWSKGGGSVTMQVGPSGNSGQFTNQFLVHTPKAAPKKRGLFGRS